MKILAQVVGTSLVVVFFVALILIGNIISPVGLLSQIQNGYWGGYIQDTTGKVRILVDFEENGYERKMTILAARSYTGVFKVKLDSGDENLAEYTMQSVYPVGLTIEAKQLYVGKRYFYQRLIVGRFSDFWKINGDDSIRGKLRNKQSTAEFAIERLNDENVPAFYEDNISFDNQNLSLDQIENLFLMVEVVSADPIYKNP